MPVSVNRDPFSGCLVVRSDLRLRVPQARVLAALVPEYPTDPVSEWPTFPRARLSVMAGYTAVSGTVTRVLNGVRAGSSSGEAHPGLLARKMVEVVTIDVDGVEECCYRATTTGVVAYQAHLATRGPVPEVKAADSCTNTSRGYARGEHRQGRDRYGRS